VSVIKNISRKYLFLSAIVVIAIIVAGLEVTNTTHIFHKQKPSPVIPTKISATKPTSPSKKGTSDKSAGASTGSPATGNKQGTTSNSQAALIAPFGTFVSNHKPGQNGAPTSEQSICNTTPGASCFIQFTNGSVVKILAPQVAGSDGSTFWSWDSKDASSIGLTPGSWKVSAVASLNGQTKTSDDSIPLEIQ
jgi:hypothetical protein